MKLLFFSTDEREVGLVWSGLVEAGIDCRMRHGANPQAPGKELWVERDIDYERASLLCVQLSVLFARA